MTINGKIFVLTPLQGRHVFRFPATVREISRNNIYNYALCTVIYERYKTLHCVAQSSLFLIRCVYTHYPYRIN